MTKAADYPAYRRLLASGALAERAAAATRRLASCDLCARYCRVDRTQGIAGAACRTGSRAVVASFGPHYGEEAPITGWGGSGTIFFAWCNMRCLYCQNYELSWEGEGHELSAVALAGIMLDLQRRGCHNVNFVSPSHVVAQILEAVLLAAQEGLSLPIVYNTGGYDSPEALALLDGVVDIYMPDIKYGASEAARKYSKVRDYWQVNRAALKEMHRQVGDLVVDANGVARHGLLVRHLVLPNEIAGSQAVLRFLAEEISPNTYVNIMDQYRPCYRADDYPELDRRPSAAEIAAAFAVADRLGLQRRDAKARPRPFAI